MYQENGFDKLFDYFYRTNPFLVPQDQMVGYWFDYIVWIMLQYKFMTLAKFIDVNDDMENFLKTFSLNGIKQYSICKV